MNKRTIQWKRQRGLLILDLIVWLIILSILLTMAIRSFRKLINNAKTAEARTQVAHMFDGATAHFNMERAERGDVQLKGAGGALSTLAPHRCPHQEGQESGSTEAGITPDLGHNCNQGPGGRCVPAVGGGGPGYYDVAAWNDNDVWNSLAFEMEQAHFFHYNFVASNSGVGYGACQFTAQAFGDLDDDGIFSTFERSGAADQYGTNAAIGIYSAREVE